MVLGDTDDGMTEGVVTACEVMGVGTERGNTNDMDRKEGVGFDFDFD